MPYVVVAQYAALAGREEDLERVLREVAPLSRAEPGCRAYHIQRSVDDPSAFLLYEQYDDEAAYGAHQETEHFERLIRGVAIPLLASRIRTFYRTLD